MENENQEEDIYLPLEEKSEKEKKKTSINFEKQPTKTKKILEYLYLTQKPVRYLDICEDTGMTYNRVKALMKFLYSLKAITKEYESSRDKLTKLPKRIVWISLNEKQIKNAERVLKVNKNGL